MLPASQQQDPNPSRGRPWVSVPLETFTPASGGFPPGPSLRNPCQGCLPNGEVDSERRVDRGSPKPHLGPKHSQASPPPGKSQV